MIRKRCVKRGHKFRSWEASVVPVEFCVRLFCRSSRAAAWVPEPLRSSLQAECDRRDMRR